MAQQHLQSDTENQLVALGRALQTLREEENADVLIETTLNYLETEFKYRLIWIGLYDRLDHRLFGKGGITPTGDTTLLTQRFNLNPGDVLEQVVIQQRAIGIPDLRQESRAGEWRRAAEEFGIQGTLLFPLRCKDRCFGVALLGSHLWGVSPRPNEKAVLSLLLGGLAAALYQIEVDWQRSATKRPDQPLFQVLDELMQVPTLAQRLEAVVTMTQQFITPTRTNLYWYSPERRYFWHRVGNRQSVWRFGDSRTGAAGLTVAEASDFYQALASGQLVAIGAGRSLLKAESTERLLARLRTRSLLAAPIRVRGELLGFLAVEDNGARIWEEAESSYVRAMAQVLALVAGSEEMEAKLQLASEDTKLAAEIAQAIAHSHDTTTVLKECAGLLCKHLEAELFLLLQEGDNGQFTITFQQQPPNRRPLNVPLAALSLDDQQLLLKNTEAVMIEDLEADLQLFKWRESLNQLGMRSALLVSLGRSLPSYQVGKTSNSDKLSLLVIGHGSPRTWNQRSQELVRIVAQQINLLLTLGQLQDSARVSFLANQTLQTGLSTLSQAALDPAQFEAAWVNYLANLFKCPLAALISWTPQSDYAAVATKVVADPRFALSPDVPISVANDTLIQQTLATPSFLCYSVADLPAPTRKWLSSPGIGQLLVIGLHNGATPTTGIVILADHEERQWPHHLLPPVETLTQHFAWFRHYQHHASSNDQGGENLERLNWYKHRCLETFHQSVAQTISILLELEAKTPLLSNPGEFNQPNPSGDINTEPSPTSDQPLRQMRRQQLLHQLEQTLAILKPVLQEEQWQLRVNRRPVSLVSVLKRALRDVEPLYHQRQVMLKVHNPGKFNIYSDRLKLECILFELLVTSCFQAQPGSWINLWCNPVSPESQVTLTPNSPDPLLEVLITEGGLLDDYSQTSTISPSESPPNLNLKICQDVLRSWGGNLQFYHLDQNRYASRLLLPLFK